MGIEAILSNGMAESQFRKPTLVVGSTDWRASAYTVLEGCPVAKAKSKRIVIKISARLYAKLSKLTDELGQSRSFLVQRALECYLEAVVSSQGLARPEIMEHFRRSTEENRKLYLLLGQ
jgi:predicted DNA-binding protein